jgi:hypothetical protein
MTSLTGARSSSSSPGTGFWLFLALVAIYLLSYSGGFHAIDEVSVAAMTENLVKHGEVNTDQIWWSQGWTPSQSRVGVGGHLYSKKGIGTALVGAPFYWLALQGPALGAVKALMLANALVTALTGWLVYRCILLLGYRPVVAVLTALAYGLGTMAWPYAKYFFSEPPTAAGLMLALWGLLSVRQKGQARYVVVAGSGLGLVLLAKVANAVTWPLFLAYGLWIAMHLPGQQEMDRGARWKRLILLALAFLAPLVVAGLMLLVYNYMRTGSLLDLGYAADETFSTPLGRGLAGLLFSPGKSLFLFSPLLVVALLGIPRMIRRDWETALLSLGVVAAYLLVYARWFMWWGGWSWGPRFLVPVLPFLSLFLAPVLDYVLDSPRLWLKGLLAALALLSLGVQILGVAVDFNQYLLQLYERGIDSSEANFRADLSPMLGHWNLLRAGEWDLVWARDVARGLDWTMLLLPLALLVVAGGGWYAGRRAGRPGRWLLAGIGVGLLVASAVVVAHLPAPADDWEGGAQALSARMEDAAQPGDALIVDLLPYANHLARTTALLERYKATPTYWGWARQEPVSSERQALLARLVQEHSRLWLALDTTPEGDPASTTEQWLDEHAFRVESEWLSPEMRLVRYQLPSGALDDEPQARLNLRLGDRLWLDGTSPRGTLEAQAGQDLVFSLFWQAEASVDESYVVFVQLLDQAGRLWAQADRVPVGGFRPTHTWQPGQVIRDNYGLALPPDVPAGQYRLIAGLYLPSSMERLEIRDAEGNPIGDYALLAEVTVTGQDLP